MFSSAPWMTLAVTAAGGEPFVSTDLAGGFVHVAVEGVAVDGCGAGVEPHFGRICEFADDFAEQAC